MHKKKLHVLQVTGAMNRGGLEVMVMDLYRNVSPEVRFDFLINTKKNNPQPIGDFDEEISMLGGRMLYIGTQWELGPVKYIKEFKKIIHNIGKPDVVHIHLNSRCGGIALAARLCGIKKVIAHSHNYLLFDGPFLQDLVEIMELNYQKILIALFATDFWGCSRKSIEQLYYSWIISKGKSIILNNAINVLAFQSVSLDETIDMKKTYQFKGDPTIIGNVGRIIKRKNIDFAIDMLKVLVGMGLDYVFVFAGRVDDKDYMEKILKKVRAYHLEDRVLHLGDRDDVPAIMSTFDVFVAPNQNEAFGMVAVEAQAAGLHCVLSSDFTPAIDMGIDLVSFIGNFDPVTWANEIVKVVGKKCVDKDFIYEQIKNCGFDTSENTKRVEQLYRS